MEAGRAGRDIVYLYHPLVLFRHRRLDRKIFLYVFHRSFRICRSGKNRRDFRSLCFKSDGGDLLSGNIYAGHGDRRIVRDKGRHRAELQDNDADAVRGDAYPHSPRGDAAGRDGRNRVLSQTRLLKSDLRDVARGAGAGIFLAFARRGRDHDLRQLSAQDGEHHLFGEADMLHRHGGRFPRGADDLPRRFRLRRGAGGGSRTDLHHRPHSLREDERRRGLRGDFFPALFRRGADLLDIAA